MEPTQIADPSRVQLEAQLDRSLAALARYKALLATLPADLPGAWGVDSAEQEVVVGVLLQDRQDLDAWRACLHNPDDWQVATLNIACDDARFVRYRLVVNGARLNLIAPKSPPPPDEACAPPGGDVWTRFVESLDFSGLEA